MSAWTECVQEDNIKGIDKEFEDNFAPPESSSDFKKLEDSDDYLKVLGEFCNCFFYNSFINLVDLNL